MKACMMFAQKYKKDANVIMYNACMCARMFLSVRETEKKEEDDGAMMYLCAYI